MLKSKDIQFCKGIGSSIANKLKKINIESVEDLLFYFPRKYQDRKNILKIKDISNDVQASVFIEIVTAKTNYIRRGFCITRVSGKDETGQINLIWYNQPYLNRVFKTGDKIFIYGKVSIKNGKAEILNPEYEILKDDDIASCLHMGRIVPVYGLTAGITNKVLRKIVNNAIAEHKNYLEEFLPEIIVKERKLPDIFTAVDNIHFPEDLEFLKRARLRFVYEELFMLMLALKYRKNMIKEVPRFYKYKTDEKTQDEFFKTLSFELTAAQKRVCSEIMDDFNKNAPMQRILIGDVGCGKTVVAAFAVYMAVSAGFQAAYMAPTEILAMQHYKNLENLLSKFGIKTLLLTSGIAKGKKEKDEIYAKIKNKEVDFIIGTHSLLQEKVEYKNLSLVIIDEQHKFGVRQRLALAEKGINPDLLVMTATPIPRTLALSLFGDMDISIIDEMPKGRGKINSYFRSFASAEKVYDFILGEVAKGRQGFIVCPLIEENEDNVGAPHVVPLRSVEKEYNKLKNGAFKNINIDFLHGRMDNDLKELVMKKFKDGVTQVLFTTTVIEVGIDIPNATVMVIKNADRFGLAQLHQLRGRIGRGINESYCVLMSGIKNEETINRLKNFCLEGDGFRIAQMDLENRGTGEFFGWAQHGFPELRVADPLRDIKVLEAAKQDVEKILPDNKFLDKSPNLKTRMNKIFTQDQIIL